MGGIDISIVCRRMDTKIFTSGMLFQILNRCNKSSSAREFKKGDQTACLCLLSELICPQRSRCAAFGIFIRLKSYIKSLNESDAN
jgi:hypothetical protein